MTVCSFRGMRFSSAFIGLIFRIIWSLVGYEMKITSFCMYRLERRRRIWIDFTWTRRAEATFGDRAAERHPVR